ncbi:heme A synthase [Sulfitobacter sp. HNIBRBA3233]|uniref:heme A synthase n=1 Tax=Sulfitobacter marinivivus TaxID=3158558 RepID=UPI0032DFD62A
MAKTRKLFEEVGETATTRPVATKGVIDAGKRGARGAIRVWLMILFALVFLMILVGGATRLTDSGLSITEWRPVTGALPPLNAEDWASEFDKYRQIDEYQLQNKGMTLSEFKFIYWWEWGHRQLGRVIGLVWFLGFMWFLLRRQIPAGWTPRLLLLGGLGGLQGAIGWWMVASGVTTGEGMLDVASYRLATHLGLAFVILGLITWYALLLGRTERDLIQVRRAREPGLSKRATGLMHVTFLQIILGALVAGIDAGRTYNDWPMMAGAFLPPYPFELEPVWRNFFENAGLVQFIHRITAYVLFAYGAFVWLQGRKSTHAATRFAFNAVMAVLSLQVVWGIVTVLYAAPVQIALVHQGLAVVLWVLILRARHLAMYPQIASLRGKSA